MADIRADRSEIFHYADPDFKFFCDKNWIPKNCIFPEMTLHWHEDIELIYVISGTIKYQMNGRLITMSAGEGIFVNAKQLHVIVSTDVEAYLYCVIFHPTILGSTKRIMQDYVNSLIECGSIPYIVLSENTPWQKEILDRIADIYVQTNKENGELKAMALLNEIWLLLWENSGVRKQEKPDYNDDLSIVRQMMEFVQDNYMTKITLDDIADYGNVGKTKCTELFSTYTHMTPIKYVRTYRIEKSIELLGNTQLGITDIALKVGFSGSSFYAQTFKEITGMSPKSYRSTILGCHDAASGRKVRIGGITESD